MLCTVCVSACVHETERERGREWDRSLNAAPPSFLPPSFPFFIPSFLFLALLFPSCISCFSLDYSALLLRVAHSISLALSSLATARASHSVPCINLCAPPPPPPPLPSAYSASPLKGRFRRGKGCEERRFYSVFQFSPVLIELFCNPAPSKTKRRPHSRSCLLRSSARSPLISLMPLCFPGLWGPKAGAMLNLKGFVPR